MIANKEKKIEKILELLREGTFPKAYIAQRTKINYYDIKMLLDEMIAQNKIEVDDAGKYFLIGGIN